MVIINSPYYVYILSLRKAVYLRSLGPNYRIHRSTKGSIKVWIFSFVIKITEKCLETYFKYFLKFSFVFESKYSFCSHNNKSPRIINNSPKQDWNSRLSCFDINERNKTLKDPIADAKTGSNDSDWNAKENFCNSD